MNVLGAAILAVLILVVLFTSRRWALLGMMAGVLFLTQAQQIEVLGLNLFAVRFLEVAGFIRVMARREFSFNQLNQIDHALLWLYGYTTLVFLIRSSVGVANQIGIAVDAFLCYFTFRGLVSDMEDFRGFLRGMIFLLLPYTLLVLIESVTGHNPFSILGGITGGDYWTRHGRPRCFGSFRQPDTLGMFGASFLPLYISLACITRERMRAFVGIAICLVLVLAANSGGPAAGAAIGFFCWVLWRFRTEMRKVRWGIVAMIALLALVMKSPVWFIFDRVSIISGGDGWHRSYLIDVAIRHLGLWWLAGMPIMDTKDWFPYHLTSGTADITNKFIDFGISAGSGAIVLFVLLLTRAFSYLGRALNVIRSSSQYSRNDEFLFWGFGVMLMVHIVDWFGVTYFDQMYMVWFMQLAAIATVTQACLTRPVAVEVEEQVIDPKTVTPQPSQTFQPSE